MQAHVATGFGVEAAIDELWRRNAAVTTARGESPSASPASDFVCNSARGHNFGLVEGRPHATRFFTVEQLERSGLVGLYRPQIAPISADFEKENLCSSAKSVDENPPQPISPRDRSRSKESERIDPEQANRAGTFL